MNNHKLLKYLQSRKNLILLARLFEWVTKILSLRLMMGGGRGCQRVLGGEEGLGRKSVGGRRGVAGNIGEVWGGVML